MTCPLCHSDEKIRDFDIPVDKKYYLCGTCKLVYAHPQQYLSPEKELQRYSFHQNSLSDEGYVKFLRQVIDPALKYINPNMCGLDFGCGPNPVLSKLLKSNNINCDFYDPYFFPDIPDNRKYDFVFATECFEHFFNPSSELQLISSMLNKNGILAIMTEFYPEEEKFADWYYIKDPTHVCFYNLEVLDYICKSYKYERICTDSKRVAILRKL